VWCTDFGLFAFSVAFVHVCERARCCFLCSETLRYEGKLAQCARCVVSGHLFCERWLFLNPLVHWWVLVVRLVWAVVWALV